MNVDKYKGLIFDMDGTLIDTMPSHLDAWQQTSEKFEFPYDRQWMNSLGGMPSPKITLEINKKFGLELEPKQVASFKMDRFEAIEDKGDLITLTTDIVRRCFGDKPMAVGTGSQRVTAIPLLEKSGLIEFFDAVVTATEVENHKPNPDTFLKASQQLGIDASDCVVFEDTELGKQAAHAAGMDCIMVQGDELVFYPLTR